MRPAVGSDGKLGGGFPREAEPGGVTGQIEVQPPAVAANPRIAPGHPGGRQELDHLRGPAPGDFDDHFIAVDQDRAGLSARIRAATLLIVRIRRLLTGPGLPRKADRGSETGFDPAQPPLLAPQRDAFPRCQEHLRRGQFHLAAERDVAGDLVEAGQRRHGPDPVLLDRLGNHSGEVHLPGLDQEAERGRDPPEVLGHEHHRLGRPEAVRRRAKAQRISRQLQFAGLEERVAQEFQRFVAGVEDQFVGSNHRVFPSVDPG